MQYEILERQADLMVMVREVAVGNKKAAGERRMIPMSQYTTEIVSILDLVLDAQNPRFIEPPKQDEIRQHLLEHEDIIGLAKSIVSYNGLMPGERPIICKEDGRMVVLEGNRRVCTCQLLLDNSLIPPNFQSEFPMTPEELRNEIELIEVDVIESRAVAEPVLATRHMEQIRQWAPLAKWKFCVNRFEDGRTIEEISNTTGISKTKVKEGIQNFYLLEYALNLPDWTPKQRNLELNLYNIQPHRFIRIFNTKGAKKILRMSFDSETLRPQSKFTSHVFRHAIAMIVKSTLLVDEANTRSRLEDIPELLDFTNVDIS